MRSVEVDFETVEDVADAGPEGEDGCDDGGVNNGEVSDFQHHPDDEGHLGDGADFTEPARFDGHAPFEIIENSDSAKDNDIAGDNKSGKPDGDMPVVGSPWGEGEGDDGGE